MVHHIRKKHPECNLPKRHVNHKHFNDLKCQQCTKTFLKTGPFRSHLIQTHIKEISDPCEKCYDNIKKSETIPTLGDHGSNALSCQKCENKYCSEVYLKIHELQHKREIICPTCKKVFMKEWELERHLLVHSDVRAFPCRICPAAFKEARKLRRHENNVHKDTKLHCPKCDRVYSCQDSLQRHLAISHENAKIYKCTDCPRQFQTQQSLRDHIRAVHEKKMYECHRCNKKYCYRENLHRHVAVIHRNIRIKCTQCERTFQNKVLLTNHQQREHMLNPTKYACLICNKKYFTRENLVEHMQHGHRQQTFKCTTCNQILSCKRSLEAHIEKKHGETNRERFKCKVCYGKYKHVGELEQHMTEKNHLDLPECFVKLVRLEITSS